MKKRLVTLLSYVLVAALSSFITAAMFYGFDGVSKLDQLSALIDTCFVDGADRTVLEDAAANAMVKATGDRWSYYIPAAEYASYLEEAENAYVGIGITITVAHDGDGFQIMEVNEAGPAVEAGLQTDDVITAIDGQSASGMTTTDARNLVRGKEGTPVEITVRRGGETLTFSVTRRKMQTVVTEGKMLTDTVGMVTIDNFEGRSASETISVIEELLAQGARSLVFDVRNNPGGYASEMVKILDYLLPEGDLFRTVDYRGEEAVETSDADCLDIPMVVVVNRDTYSAAEFFAVALHEYDAAVVVGEKTTGKGHFQQTFPLSDGSAVAISTGKYFTPRGICLEGVGITPDVEVVVDEGQALEIYYGRLDPMEDPQLLAALKALE